MKCNGFINKITRYSYHMNTLVMNLNQNYWIERLIRVYSNLNKKEDGTKKNTDE